MDAAQFSARMCVREKSCAFAFFADAADDARGFAPRYRRVAETSTCSTLFVGGIWRNKQPRGEGMQRFGSLRGGECFTNDRVVVVII